MAAEPAILSEREIRVKFPSKPALPFRNMVFDEDNLLQLRAIVDTSLRGMPTHVFYLDSFPSYSSVHTMKSCFVQEMIDNRSRCLVCDEEREKKLSVAARTLIDLVEDIMPDVLRPVPAVGKATDVTKRQGRALRPMSSLSSSTWTRAWAASTEIRGGRLRASHFQNEHKHKSVLDEIIEKFGPKPSRKDWDASGNLERHRHRYPMRRAA